MCRIVAWSGVQIAFRGGRHRPEPQSATRRPEAIGFLSHQPRSSKLTSDLKLRWQLDPAGQIDIRLSDAGIYDAYGKVIGSPERPPCRPPLRRTEPSFRSILLRPRSSSGGKLRFRRSGQNCQFGAKSYTHSWGAMPSARLITSKFRPSASSSWDTGRTLTLAVLECRIGCARLLDRLP